MTAHIKVRPNSGTIRCTEKSYRNFFVKNFMSCHFSYDDFCRTCRTFRVICRKMVVICVCSFRIESLLVPSYLIIDFLNKTYRNFFVENFIFYIFVENNFYVIIVLLELLAEK